MKPTSTALCVAAFVLCAPAYAAGSGEVVAAHAAIPGVSPEPEEADHELEAGKQLDEEVENHVTDDLDEEGLQGAAVVIVKDGKIILKQGYGYADFANRVKVDPDTTLFRVGSVSKLLTWTAVMQMIERGQLNESADVNQYLDGFRIPAAFAHPVTLRNLMTHTAGFEVNHFGWQLARGAAETLTLTQTLALHMPARVRDPEQAFEQGLGAYSNWAAALAGYIVALRSKEPFDDYVEQNILAPLEMRHSTFREPVPPAMGRVPIGYPKGRLQPAPFEYFHGEAPAGSLTTTAADMANFMIAHLQDGCYGKACVLGTEAVQLMHARHFGPNPYLNGSADGFFETYINGRRVIEHGGATVYFSAHVALIPDEHVGIFIAFNGPAGLPVTAAFVRHIIDEYFPAELPPMKPPPDFDSRAARYVGDYRFMSSSYTKSEKLLNPWAQAPVEVLATDHHTLLIRGLIPATSSAEFTEVEHHPGLFRRVDGDEMIAFTPDDNRPATHILSSEAFHAAERIGWLESARFTTYVWQVFLFGFVLAAATALPRARGDSYRGARRLAAALAAVNLLILAGVEKTRNSDTYTVLISLPWYFKAALVLALVSVALTVAMIYATVGAWRRSNWPLFGRIEYTAIALLAVVFVCWLHLWNLIGFNLA